MLLAPPSCENGVPDQSTRTLVRSAGFAGGIAHQGISHSARSVWATVKDVVEGMLREYDGYQLVLTGGCSVAGVLVFYRVQAA